MNKRKPDQIMTTKSERSFLFRIVVITAMIAVLLSGCGKKKANDDIQAVDTESLMLSAAESTDQNSLRLEDIQHQENSYAKETETEAVETETIDIETEGVETETIEIEAEGVEIETESTDAVFYPVNFSDAKSFQCDYGFSENRAWVRSDTFEYDLIDPNGEIIYEVPSNVVVEGLSNPVQWYDASDYYASSFNSVKNGTTYITGKVNYQYDVSVIIDADGNELAYFIGTDDMDCYIAGRTDDRFLLICIDKSGNNSKLYCIPIGNDGNPVDVPRLISQGDFSRNTLKVSDFGEGIFYLDYLGAEYFAYYNLNNNTVQKSVSWEGKYDTCRFYDRVTLSNGYLLTLDMLQADRANLVFTNKVGKFVSWDSHFNQLGRIWAQTYLYDKEAGLFDYTGDEIAIPKEIGNKDGYAELQTSDDGYVLFREYASTGKILLSMMDPDNNFLYIQKAFSEEVDPKIGRGGYVLAREWNKSGIIDREGVLHSLSDDLSALPGLSELYFNGFGSGYLLEIEMHLGINQDSGKAIIRSLDGKQNISSFKKTDKTRFMSNTLVSDTVIDLSQAKPVGLQGSGNTAETTSEDEIRSMGESGIIIVDSFWDENQEFLLFEKDGVRIIWHDWDLEVENANPDNKKVDVYLSEKFYDGIYIDKNYPGSHGGTGLLKSGESAVIDGKVFDSEIMFMREVTDFASGLSELPLMEVTLRFTVQIGSQSEPVEYTRVLRTSTYSEENLSAIYGDLVGDYEYEGELVYSVYRIQDANANVFAVRNRTDAELFAKYYPWFAECAWLVNGEQYGGIFQLVIPPEGIGIVTFPNVESLYKELELPNGTPINLELSIPLPDFENDFYGNVIKLDLGQLSN